MLPAVPRPSHLNMKPEPQTFSKPHLPSPASTQNQQTGSTQRKPHRGNWKHPLSNEHQKLIPVSVISNHFEKSGQSQVQRGWFIFLFFYECNVCPETMNNNISCRSLVLFHCRLGLIQAHFQAHPLEAAQYCVGGSCVYWEPLKAHLQLWWPRSCSHQGN